MKTVAIVIPIYKKTLNWYEDLSFKCLQVKLSNFKCFVVKPFNLNPQFDCQGVSFVNLSPRCFRNIEAYNNLMLSPRFYRKFIKYEYILIYQLDSLVLRKDLLKWCNYGCSYIGAPWLKRNWKKEPVDVKAVGNGGFSLRRVQDFIRVLNSNKVQLWPRTKQARRFFLQGKHFKLLFSIIARSLILRRKSRKPIAHYFRKLFFRSEDEFWSYYAPQLLSWYKIAEPKKAIDFAFEAYPDKMLIWNQNKIPFGAHAYFRYYKSFYEKILKKNNIKK